MLSTGQNVVKGILGTVVGVAIGGGLVTLIGTDTTVLWCLLPLAILVVGFAPAAISFAAGQAAFTITLEILYNIIQPAGWRIGLVRFEDVAIGCAVSLGVGLLFWPRGATAALGTALSEAYEESVHYLANVIGFGMSRIDRSAPLLPAAAFEAGSALSASLRLDDTFRGYLAERGSKTMPLAEVTTLVTGPTALRLAGDAVLDLWQRDPADVADRTDACVGSSSPSQNRSRPGTRNSPPVSRATGKCPSHWRKTSLPARGSSRRSTRVSDATTDRSRRPR